MIIEERSGVVTHRVGLVMMLTAILLPTVLHWAGATMLSGDKPALWLIFIAGGALYTFWGSSE